jgi:hypothetical protein
METGEIDQPAMRQQRDRMPGTSEITAPVLDRRGKREDSMHACMREDDVGRAHSERRMRNFTFLRSVS